MFEDLAGGFDAVKDQESLDRLWSLSEERGARLPSSIGRTYDDKTIAALGQLKTMSKAGAQQQIEKDRQQQIALTESRQAESERHNRESEAARDRAERARQEKYDADETRREADETRKERREDREDRKLELAESKRKALIKKGPTKAEIERTKEELVTGINEAYPDNRGFFGKLLGGDHALTDNEVTRMADDVHSKVQEKMLADPDLSHEEARDAALEEVVSAVKAEKDVLSYKKGGASNAPISPTTKAKPASEPGSSRENPLPMMTPEVAAKLSSGTWFTDDKGNPRQRK